MDSHVEDIAEQLFKEIEKVYSDKGSLTDDLLKALNFTFGTPLLQALDLVDRKHVTIVTSPSGRKILQIKGSSGTPYTCLVSSNYCSCPAYKYSILRKEEHIMCKHVLAAKISQSMGLLQTNEVSNEVMALMISTID